MDEQQRYERARKQVGQLRAFYIHLVVYILVNAFLVILSLSTGGNWSIWPLLLSVERHDEPGSQS